MTAQREFLGWTRVELATGESGWLRREALVRLYAAPQVPALAGVAGASPARALDKPGRHG